MPEENRNMTDQLSNLSDPILKLFDMVIQKDFAEADKVRSEIKQKGILWAADEIHELRRKAAALEKRLHGNYPGARGNNS
jgi:hypothetical protein